MTYLGKGSDAILDPHHKARWFTQIDSQINKLLSEARFTRHSSRSSFEELTITAKLGNTDLIITNVYIPPASSCTGGYNPSLDHLMKTTNTLILGNFNAHHSSWYSSSIDTRGTMLEGMVSGSNFGLLNWDSPTRLPGNANPSSPDFSLASASLITSTNWQTMANQGSDHLPILISLQMYVTITQIQHHTSINLKRANWDRYSRGIEAKLRKRRIPIDCQKKRKVLAYYYS